MVDVTVIQGLSETNANTICDWTNSKGEDFLTQWAGCTLNFPLTASQLISLKDFYSIFYLDEFAGCIHKIREEERNVHIGHFLVNPQMTGKGIGQKALTIFIELLFGDRNIDSISLVVFDDNIWAKKLYIKNGFKIIQTIELPKKKHKMKKFRKQTRFL